MNDAKLMLTSHVLMLAVLAGHASLLYFNLRNLLFSRSILNIQQRVHPSPSKMPEREHILTLALKIAPELARYCVQSLGCKISFLAWGRVTGPCLFPEAGSCRIEAGGSTSEAESVTG